MGKDLRPREGVTYFEAGRTPGWGDLEFSCDGKVVEGVKIVDVAEGYGVIFARDAFGNWPALDHHGWPITLVMQGNWTAAEVFPPDVEFEEARMRNRKRGKTPCN